MGKSKGNPKFEIPGLKRDATIGWALAYYSPCFWCDFIPNAVGHYTIKFGKCQILNNINHEDTKGTKENGRQ